VHRAPGTFQGITKKNPGTAELIEPKTLCFAATSLVTIVQDGCK
jgi:hypothetical protein